MSMKDDPVPSPPLAAAGSMLADGELDVAVQARSLRECQARLRAMSAQALDAVVGTDEAGRLIEFNPAAEVMFGWRRDEALGQLLSELLIPEQHRGAHQTGFERFLRTGEMRIINRRIEITALRRDRAEFPIELTIGVFEERGQKSFFAYIRDISERKQAEQHLRIAAAAFESQEGMVVTDAARVILRVNQAFTDITGYAAAEIVGSQLQLLSSARHDSSFYLEMWESVYGAGRWQGEIWNRCKDGDEHPHWLTITAVMTDERVVSHHVITLIDISERKKTEEALKTLSRAVEQSPVSIVITDPKAEIRYVNPKFEQVTGYCSDEAVGQNPRMLSSGEKTPDDYLELWSTITSGKTWEGELHNRRKDGHLFWEKTSISPVLDERGELINFVAVKEDITARKIAEQELRIAAIAFESQEGMFVTDRNSVIQRVNRAFTEITGYKPAEAVGQTPRLLRSGHHDAAFYADMMAGIKAHGVWQGEIWNRRKNGEVFPEWLTITAVNGSDGETSHYVSTLTDITQRKAAEEEIKHLAFYDPLTQLPNRRLLRDRLQQALASSTRSGREGALLFIDLDNFKTLNDTMGHDKGDLLLQRVAQRLTTCIREGDTVARLGGDEFVVMLEDLSANPQEAATHAEVVGEKILLALNQPYILVGHRCDSTPSIGITLFTDHQNSIDELLKQADLAMYQAKAAGRNTLRFFDPGMQAEVTARVALEADLREAIRSAQFLLYYQPQVATDGRLIGAEALVRWQHPRRGLVSPLQFIPLAEETGLILLLGHWVLETACAQLVAWAAQAATAHLSLAVNVSARQFRHVDFVDQVLAVINQSGANPHRLKLELTESLLLDNVDDIIGKMLALRSKGVSFSLDDFGTGYSSLSYLKRLPLDQLKIDQSFVRDVFTDINDAAIVQAIIALGQTMGLSVIAEGVETEEQRDFLARLGCNAYQGYLFGRPGPVAQLGLSGRPVETSGRRRPDGP